MRNTPITDELARQFAGKRLSSREAGAVWSLCRDLERELNKVITTLAQSKDANAGLMRACDKHERELINMTKQRDTLADALQEYLTSTKSGGAMQEMAKLSGRVLFYERLRECRKIAEQALAAMKGGSHE
jgi:hypothetical protein